MQCGIPRFALAFTGALQIERHGHFVDLLPRVLVRRRQRHLLGTTYVSDEAADLLREGDHINDAVRDDGDGRVQTSRQEHSFATLLASLFL